MEILQINKNLEYFAYFDLKLEELYEVLQKDNDIMTIMKYLKKIEEFE